MKPSRKENDSITNENALKTPHARARVWYNNQFRMFAELWTSPSCQRFTLLDNPPDFKDWESESDDGSDYGPGVNYLNIDLEVSNINSSYDPVFVEEDGDYDVDFE